MSPNTRRNVQILLYYLRRILNNHSLKLQENRDMLENRLYVIIFF